MHAENFHIIIEIIKESKNILSWRLDDKNENKKVTRQRKIHQHIKEVNNNNMMLKFLHSFCIMYEYVFELGEKNQESRFFFLPHKREREREAKNL